MVSWTPLHINVKLAQCWLWVHSSGLVQPALNVHNTTSWHTIQANIQKLSGFLIFICLLNQQRWYIYKRSLSMTEKQWIYICSCFLPVCLILWSQLELAGIIIWCSTYTSYNVIWSSPSKHILSVYFLSFLSACIPI